MIGISIASTMTELWDSIGTAHFAEYHIVDVRVTFTRPGHIGFQTAAPLACGGFTDYRAIMVSEVKEGAWLAIVGAGGALGHFGI